MPLPKFGKIVRWGREPGGPSLPAPSSHSLGHTAHPVQAPKSATRGCWDIHAKSRRFELPLNRAQTGNPGSHLSVRAHEFEMSHLGNSEKRLGPRQTSQIFAPNKEECHLRTED